MADTAFSRTSMELTKMLLAYGAAVPSESRPTISQSPWRGA
ncbi:Hypothetical Protein RradSPS_2866 (plasmid) [Rubrobacter radiotolerans]|uniref:Uncharacterized protein n=1 Tax=Rubrobacter radiotolerans TaxID=42256 RepID=A0A023X7W6_RUBRA|nr:Hypothetical Protein RradSPS_2866 [Rubrobacter radiotolerans]